MLFCNFGFIRAFCMDNELREDLRKKMPELKLKIINKSFSTIAASRESDNLAVLAFQSQYEEGDLICLELSECGHCCEIQFDDALKPAIVYIPGNSIYFQVPFHEKRKPLTPKAFSGACHVITARILYKNEFSIRSNLSLNPYDGFVKEGLFPHAESNVEYQAGGSFAPRNAIDGVCANLSHGNFPYQSWGTNKCANAEWKIDFGRAVYIDELRIALRADFPHDNFWETAEAVFSDQSVELLSFKKTAGIQRFTFKAKKAEWIVLKNMKQAKALSPFPALSQFEAWGTIEKV